MPGMATWKQLLGDALEHNGETFEDLEALTLTEAELDVEFDDGYGTAHGKPFTAWSKKWVYVPVEYDGSEWVRWVARNPDGKPTDHLPNARAKIRQ